MKKLLVICFMVLSLVFAGNAMADPVEFGPAGWYVKQNGVTKYQFFGGGHPVNQSEWDYYGENPPEEPFETPEVLRTASLFMQNIAGDPSHAFDGDITKQGSYAQADGLAGYGGEFRLFADAAGDSCNLELVYGSYYFYGPRYGWHLEWVSTPNEAFVGSILTGDAELIAVGKAGTFAEVIDSGYTTTAESKSFYDYGYVTFRGSAVGEQGDLEYISTQVKFNGLFSQENYAVEQEGNDFAQAGQWSSLNFDGEYDLKDYTGNGYVGVWQTYYSGINAETYGFSTVTIDPGKSFSAQTENYSTLSFDPCKYPSSFVSQVTGAGNVGGNVVNGWSFAAGNASFNYAGYTNGSGVANVAGQITNMPNGATMVKVTGSSSTVTNSVNPQ